MLFRFTIISDEVDEFLREIKIDADSTFLDFCEAILASCNYEDDQVTSFYITNDEWEKQCEITREDMGFTPYDEDVYTMDKTSLFARRCSHAFEIHLRYFQQPCVLH